MDLSSANAVEDALVAQGGLLTELEKLVLTSRSVATGAVAGIHASSKHGSSIEFSEHKVYTPGDDIRHIDWRAFGKTDRYHVKRFENETNLRVELLVDHSASMGFGSSSEDTNEPIKLDFAKTLAGALAYLALRQGDQTGLLAFSDAVTEELPPRSSSSHLMEIFDRLVRLQPMRGTHITESLHHFATTRRRSTVTVVISDLFDANPLLMEAFRHLAAHRHDVVVFHTLARAELDFPFENPSTFVSMEDQRRLFIHPRVFRPAYVAQMNRFLEDTQRTMSEVGIDYHLVVTDEDPTLVLGQFLRQRSGHR